MDMTVGDLRVGTKLKFGKYTAGGRGGTPVPVVWIKVDVTCKFITEHAIDYLCFDSMEMSSQDIDARWHGNPEYQVSNIHQYLNSCGDKWFLRRHMCDSPPDYANLPGFLTWFLPHEVDAIRSPVSLPRSSDLIGDRRLKVFCRSGMRPRPTEDFLLHRRFCGDGFDEHSYVDFWCQDHRGSSSRYIRRDGTASYDQPRVRHGLRPVCEIRPMAEVEVGEDGLFQLKHCEARDDAVETYSVNDIYELLGLR